MSCIILASSDNNSIGWCTARLLSKKGIRAIVITFDLNDLHIQPFKLSKLSGDNVTFQKSLFHI